MITQDEVVAAVAGYLQRQGWEILQAGHIVQIGHGISARKGANDLTVTAIGATSSRRETARYGLEFTPSQKLTHVSRAFYRAGKIFNDGKQPGIALPKTEQHVRLIDNVDLALLDLGVVVFFVSCNGVVEEMS